MPSGNPNLAVVQCGRVVKRRSMGVPSATFGAGSPQMTPPSSIKVEKVFNTEVEHFNQRVFSTASTLCETAGRLFHCLSMVPVST